MQSKSLKEAMAAAEVAAPPSAGGKGPWETGLYNVEIIESAASERNGTWSISLKLQREDTSRRFMDVYFDEANPKGFQATYRKIRTLLGEALLGEIDAAFPDDPESQIRAVANKLLGVKFVAKCDKVESNKNAPGTKEEDKVYRNFFDVKELLDGAAAGISGASGFGAVATATTTPGFPSAGFMS